MALFTAKRHTWDYPYSVDYDDFFYADISNHALHADNDDCSGICWDGTNFFVVDFVDRKIYKYTDAWVYVSNHVLNIGNTRPYGVCWDGSNFWVIDEATVGVREVYKYTDAWVYVSKSNLHADNDLPRGMCWDGTYFYVLDGDDDQIYKYNSAWAFQEAFDVIAAPFGVEWDGTYFYILGSNRMVYRYDTNWNLLTYYDITGVMANGSGICYDGSNFYVLNTSNERAYKFNFGNTTNTIGGHRDSIVLNNGLYEPWAAAHMTGFVEYWFRVVDASEKTNIIFYDATGNECINIYIDAETLIADGSNILDPALDNKFYRIGIDFDCTPNTYDAYLNGALIVNDEAFAVNDDGSGLTGIKTEVDTNGAGNLDGIGYDWDPDYDQGDNDDDTVDITSDIIGDWRKNKIVEELGVDSFADLEVKGITISDFEAGHEIDFYDSDAVLSWVGRILYPESVRDGTETIGKLKLIGINSQFNNIYRKNFTTARDSDYIIKHIIDNVLTRYHSYNDEIDNFTITYKYDLKTKISKMFNYLAMLERGVLHYKPNNEVFFNKYDNLTATGLSWDEDTSNIRITSYTPVANRHITRAPVVGASNDLGQVYYVGKKLEDEDQYGINKLQDWRDPEITNFTEAKQLGDNLQIIYSLDTQWISILAIKKKHIQVGYTVELVWNGVFSIALKDFLVTKRVWYPMIDRSELELTDNILTRKAFDIRVINKFYDEDAQQSYDESDVPESTEDGIVQPLSSISELRVAGPGGPHTLASHTTKEHQELTDYNAEANVKHLTDAQVGALHSDVIKTVAHVEAVITDELAPGESIDNRIDALLTANADGYYTEADDKYLKNDANDETTGDLTVANLITAGLVDGQDVAAMAADLANQCTVAEAHAHIEDTPLTMTQNITFNAGQLFDGKDVSGLATAAEAHAYIEANALTLTQDITFNAGQLFDGKDVSTLGTDAEAHAYVEANALTMTQDITFNAGQLFDGVDVSGLCTAAEAHAYVEANALTMTQNITFNAGQLFDGKDVSGLGTVAEALTHVQNTGLTMGANIVMGAHDITLGAGQLVDGRDISADINQAVKTTDSPTFVGLTLSANLVTSSTIDGQDIAAMAADLANQCTVAEAIAAVLADNKYVRNYEADTMTGDLTVPNIICAGNVDGVDVSVFNAAMREQSAAFPGAPVEGDRHYDEVLDSEYRYNAEALAWIEIGVGGGMGADNLGNHIATEDLDMDNYKIVNLAKTFNRTERFQGNHDVFEKKKEILILVSGNIKFYWSMRSLLDTGEVYTKLYVNGIAVGVQKATYSETYVEFDDTITVNAGDLVQLYAKGSAGGIDMYVKDFYVNELGNINWDC